MTAKKSDQARAAIRAALALLIEPGDVIELRALEVDRDGRGWRRTVYGYFDDLDRMADEAAALDGKAPGIYFTLNPCKPELLARVANRTKEATSKKDLTTADNGILRRRWLLVDLDSDRLAGISSTDAEHAAAIDLAETLAAKLAAQGWPAPILADSGNGAHLLYRVDLPNDPAALDLVSGCLAALAADPAVAGSKIKVDQAVCNAARICKVYGTLACKGENMKDRPHRRAAIIRAPDQLAPVPLELLQALAGEVKKAEPAPRPTAPAGDGIDVPAWCQRVGLTIADTAPWRDATRYRLDRCPFNPDHADAAIIRHPSGAVSFQCFHDSCKGNDWKKLRERFEVRQERKAAPEARHKRAQPATPTEEWPEPRPLPSELPPVEPFDMTLMPLALRPWIADIADRMQCPPDFPAVAAMVALGALIGRKVAIRPKRHDDWTETANLWGLICGPSGVMKSPATRQAMKPLDTLEALARKASDDDAQAFAARQKVAKLERGLLEKQATEALRKGGRSGRDEAEKLMLEAEKLEAEKPPAARRFIVNDTTVEKLGEILKANPNGVLVFRDELAGFLRSMEREGRETDRAFYLEAWNGQGSHTVDRVGRGTVGIDGLCLSILGGIQPGVLMDYVRQAFAGGAGADGLLQRFQLAVWPDVAADWHDRDRYPDSSAKGAAYDVFTRLADLDPDDARAIREDDRNELPYLRFSTDAQELFTEWRTGLERRLRAGHDHEALTSHLSKYRKLVPAMALIDHLANHGRGPIQPSTVKLAIRWARYLESHARRIFAAATTGAIGAARSLLRHIIDRDLGEAFAIREVYQNGWAGLAKKDEVEAALGVLEDHGWVVVIEKPAGQRGGRPTTTVKVNPATYADGVLQVLQVLKPRDTSSKNLPTYLPTNAITKHSSACSEIPAHLYGNEPAKPPKPTAFDLADFEPVDGDE